MRAPKAQRGHTERKTRNEIRRERRGFVEKVTLTESEGQGRGTGKGGAEGSAPGESRAGRSLVGWSGHPGKIELQGYVGSS